MKYLNLGCGQHFSQEKVWTNLDFVSTGEGVIAHNLLAGIPFPDHTFNLVYHSHVLEHFTKLDGLKFLKECYRVLKKDGIIRIAIPDLERIAKTYLQTLEIGVEDEENQKIRANYDWIMLEMYDQTVRNHGGGEMAKFLFQETIINEEFVFERIGEEGKAIRQYFLESPKNTTPRKRTLKSLFYSALRRINPFKKSRQAVIESQIGKFRLQGEVHQWMYDRYSLNYILKSIGFDKIIIRDASNSYCTEWDTYNLDQKNGQTRKPDSLFIEAIKN
ncbi:methyltransferase domain-containing protein [Pedobacter sp. LMG 31464]|uniref:Methyltransferase domain-containing protein n=1 Tax=Pedobacter planticolens TaxID=2679964 RepID=A0A923DUI3_9SPHI|nr:methyltransferase domain-containing protein [Pedobacter planticolens]MBB2144109.1 methyltransferase domain-containing protein [Pedobacter planticolens]